MANTAENGETAVVSALNIYREEFFEILERLVEFPSIGWKNEEEFEVGVKWGKLDLSLRMFFTLSFPFSIAYSCRTLYDHVSRW